MLKELKWVRDAVADKETVARMSDVCVMDGRISAYNGRMWANRPFPSEDNFTVNAKQFLDVLSKLEGQPRLKVGDNKITVSSGRRRGSIETLGTNDWSFHTEWAKGSPIPVGLLDALTKVRPFVDPSAQKPFAMCAHVHRGHVFSTNNIVLAAAECPSTANDDVLIPCWAIDFVLANKDGLVEWTYDDRSVSFYWSDGARMKSGLLRDVYPELGRAYPLGQFENDRIDFESDCNVEITPEWRSGFAFVNALGDDTIKLSDSVMRSRSGQTDAFEEVGTPTPNGIEETVWRGSALDLALRIATHWNPTRYPKPACFRGNGLQGVIASVVQR